MAEKARQEAKLDLNAASRDELAEVPGIGASTADAIISYRKQQGGFKKVDELEAVSGIGKQTLEGVRSRFKVAAQSKPATGGNGKARESAEKRPEPSASDDKRPESVAAVSPAGPETPAKAAEQAAETTLTAERRGAEEAKHAAAAQVEAMRQAGGRGAEALESASQRVDQSAEAFAGAARRNAESVAESGGMMLDAVRELQQEWFGFWQAQMQENVRAGQALASCRTPQDFLEVQAQYTRASVERFIAEGVKLRGLTGRVMACWQPLQAAGRQSLGATQPRR